ncbi:hypothetical protein MIND_00260000 [Mycena indigotica]|uniref:Uncharacterized protein n=1 Tax=Mycena indigotica TaxID=2126181 RepID=A0A8H6WBC0_9AGAR|nr:uncharacterized protein MIND_00260000 [Mycena indigotica]KAF7312464.1 hypothetical protein MIND_00260000 [Mycena indigotica]
MPTISARLDSSPVAIPSSPPRLKRSVSVASSLPTPPRTVTKRKRRTRSLHSDDEGLSSVDEASDEAPDINERLSKEAEEEEAFWRSQTQPKSEPVNGETEDQDHPLVYRRLQQASSQTFILPVSPPPSHRKPKPRVKQKVRVPQPTSTSPPSTPPAKRRKLDLPRDEANNPFLATPLDGELEVAPASAPSVIDEKPTMTFVYRGVKREFPNPYYDKAKDENPNSLLPPEHPDFEPDERGVRKLLFKVKKHTVSTPKNGSPTRRAVEVARGKSPTAAPKAAAMRSRVKGTVTHKKDDA